MTLTIIVILIVLIFLTICNIFRQKGFLPVKVNLPDRLFLFEVKSSSNSV